jgi:hypothetical protein
MSVDSCARSSRLYTALLCLQILAVAHSAMATLGLLVSIEQVSSTL